jgi:hypothetical protein
MIYNPQGLNRYSYGLNNPYKYKDDSGHIVVNVVTAAAGALAGAGIGGGINLATQLIVNDWDMSKVNWNSATASAAGGAVSGAFAGFTFGGSLLVEAGVMAGSGVTGGMAHQATSNVLSGRSIGEGVLDAKAMFQNAVMGVVGGGVTKMVFAGLSSVTTSVGSAVGNVQSGSTSASAEWTTEPRSITQGPQRLPTGEMQFGGGSSLFEIFDASHDVLHVNYYLSRMTTAVENPAIVHLIDESAKWLGDLVHMIKIGW